jgi:RNA recognition motif-containing protein
MNKVLYKSGLPGSVTDDQLNELFADCGTVDFAKVMYRSPPFRSGSFGFVEMSTPEECKVAIGVLNNSEFKGHTLNVQYSRPYGFPRDIRESHHRDANTAIREFIVDLSSTESFQDFIAAFNEGFCRHVSGEWRGNWNAFDDYLSWPEEDCYRLTFRGWKKSRSLIPEDRLILQEIIYKNAYVQVTFT